MNSSETILLLKKYSLYPSLLEQQASQQLEQAKQERAPQSCVSAIANCSLILEQVLMQHIPQQQLHILPQQFEAALAIISAASGGFNSSHPGGTFSIVKVKFPKPIPRLCNTIILCCSVLFVACFLFGGCFLFRTCFLF